MSTSKRKVNVPGMHPLDPGKRKRPTSSDTQASSPDAFKVVVVTEDYPKSFLSQDQVKEIASALFRKIQKLRTKEGTVHRLGGYSHCAGGCIITCHDQATKDWVFSVVVDWRLSNDIMLRAAEPDILIRTVKINGCFQGPMIQPVQLLRKLGSENFDYAEAIKKWVVRSTTKTSNGFHAIFKVPEPFLDEFNNSEFSLLYGSNEVKLTLGLDTIPGPSGSMKKKFSSISSAIGFPSPGPKEKKLKVASNTSPVPPEPKGKNLGLVTASNSLPSGQNYDDKEVVIKTPSSPPEPKEKRSVLATITYPPASKYKGNKGLGPKASSTSTGLRDKPKGPSTPPPVSNDMEIELSTPPSSPGRSERNLRLSSIKLPAGLGSMGMGSAGVSPVSKARPAGSATPTPPGSPGHKDKDIGMGATTPPSSPGQMGLLIIAPPKTLQPKDKNPDGITAVARAPNDVDLGISPPNRSTFATALKSQSSGTVVGGAPETDGKAEEGQDWNLGKSGIY